MKKICHIVFVFWAFSSLVAADWKALQEQVQSKSVPQGTISANIVGAEQASGKIMIFKPNTDWNDPASVVWEWQASDSSDILPEHRTWFSHPSDCKPVRGTSHLLMAASGGGVALVRLADKKTLFYTNAGGNPHSIELLPDGNVVSISSAGYFTVYAVPETFAGPQVKNAQYPIVGGHGVVWENENQRLWVLGYTELAAYQYNFDKANPAMTKAFSIPLEGTPAQWGHDLYPVPGAKALFVTGQATAIFDLATRQFTLLRDIPRIKSISQSPEGTLIVQSPSKQWWNPSILFFNQPLSPIGTRNDARFYKARFWTPNPFAAKK